MFTELLLSTILSTSFSVRTPNDVTGTKPMDYEFMVKAEKIEGDLTYIFKTDWEREMGEKYKDNVWKFNQKFRSLYGGVDYVNKESKDIKYLTYNLGFYKTYDYKNETYTSDVDNYLSNKLLENNTTFSLGMSVLDLGIYDEEDEFSRYLQYYEDGQDFVILFDVGAHVKLKWPTIDYSTKISLKESFKDNNHYYSIESEVKKWIGKTKKV